MIEFNLKKIKNFISLFFIHVFSQICQFWKNGPDKGGGDGDGETFFMGKCCEN